MKELADGKPKARVNEIRCDVRERSKNKPAEMHFRMWDNEAVKRNIKIIVEQDVDVDFAGSPAGARSPPRCTLGILQSPEQWFRRKAGLEGNREIEEVPLRNRADRFGLIDG